MNLNILENNSIIHEPANIGDAGYDIVATSDPIVHGSIYRGLHYTAIYHIEYETDLIIEPEANSDTNEFDFFMLLYPRSSIIKTNLSLANSVGVIDSGYRGKIKVCFKYIAQPEDMKIVEGKSPIGGMTKGIVTSVNPQRIYHEGDKIAQLIPCKHNKIYMNKVKHLNDTQRGDGGFGSTGK
tara:strand:- start:8668 stop:9213 length:546 start_codon:yes stop_codon:yes gene_type:complete